ncbi:MAG: GNAT family N-acetyltransferase [Actinomycetota bacterium]
MDIAAVAAGPSDVGVVAALYETAIEELRPHRGGELWSLREARPGPHDTAIDDLVGRADALVLTGRIDDVTVGYAVAVEVDLHDGRTIADLTDLFVLADARGVGVGETLMGAVTEWAAARGCAGIDSIALPGDRETKNFFESFGLVARALRVHRAID